ncbi:KTSC domain-containing protein [Paenibacillus hamazuiensis]|uniref:KTSC domain-containing protein n=1 Tax=Paenibacillus hamazuiensis TaxID=2936508 RepID=UPI00200D78B9|nr:KTSC domain-containing protein [Paenibacillus hamazuiensis]
MNFIPIGSKQIAYVRYDDQAAQMEVRYHTGRIVTYCGIRAEEYQSLLTAYNPYDVIVKLTVSKRPQPAAAVQSQQIAGLAVSAEQPEA